MNSKTILSLALFLAAALAGRAGSHTWSGAVNGLWSVAGNWSSGGVPTPGESPLSIMFPSGATRLATTNDITGLQIDTITITGDGFTFAAQAGAGITFKGTGLSVIGNGNAAFDGSMPITLNGFNYFNIATNKQVSIGGAISGSGVIAKSSPGTLRLHSAGGNSYSGGTIVNDGILLLECGGVAVPGVINIGNTNTASVKAVVRLAAPEQLANDAPVIIYPTGRIDLNGFAETVGPVTMTGGTILGNTSSLLKLHGDVTGLYWLGLAEIQCPISLEATNRTFFAGVGSVIHVSGSITDGSNVAGLIKSGPSSLTLLNSNSYRGTTAVNQGTLKAEHAFALGATNIGTFVTSGANVQLNGMSAVGLEPLSLIGPGPNLINGALQGTGTNAWAGPITLAGDADIMSLYTNSQLTLSGPISGPGALRKTGPGRLTFAGVSSNTYTNSTTIADGTLRLGKPINVNALAGPLVVGGPSLLTTGILQLIQHEQIADTAPVTVNTNGRVDFANRFDTIGALTGDGEVSLGAGLIAAGTGNASFAFDGRISGSASLALQKVGTGTLTLAGTVALGGSEVSVGKMVVNGSHPDYINVINQASLGGTGVVGNLSFNGGGLLRPGALIGNVPGLLKTGSLNMTNFASYYADILGTNAGTGYDQVRVTGSVNLSTSRLRVHLATISAAGSKFLLIDNDGGDAIAGTFTDLPEGGLFTTNSVQFQITYQGGDGNDVVLTQVTPPPPLQVKKVGKTLSGGMQVIASGMPGMLYQLQATTNLVSPDWVVVGSAVAAPTGNFAVTDEDAKTLPMRFYRYVLP